MEGWVCSYRATWSHPIFKGSAERVGVWDWMIKTAAWKDTSIDVNGHRVTVKRGQFCASQAQITAATGMPRQKLRTFLDALKREGAILTHTWQKSTKSRQMITICNYDRYQARQRATNQEPTKGQPTKEQGNNTSPIGEDAEASSLIAVSVVTTSVWNCGKQYLSSMGVDNPGSMIGRWLKGHPPIVLLSAIEAAQKSGTQDPVPYITEILKGAADGNPATVRNIHANRPPNGPDPALEQIARLAGIGEAPGHGGG